VLPSLANIRCCDSGKGGGRGAPQAGGEEGGAAGGRRWGGAPQAGGCEKSEKKKKKERAGIGRDKEIMYCFSSRVFVKMLTQPVRYEASQPCSAGGSILDMPISSFLHFGISIHRCPTLSVGNNI
jgi:hypothetical protein